MSSPAHGQRFTPSRVWLLLPAFNEAESLGILLSKIKDLSASLPIYTIVCDDGSSDGTRAILATFQESLDLEVIVHKTNRGLGETIRDLFERANELSSPNDVIVRMDSDDTHEPALIHSMIAALDRGYDIVVASRFQPGGGQIGVGRFRGLLSNAANLFMKLVFPIRGLKEYSCGYRAYRASIIRKALHLFANDFIQLKGLGFTCTLEKLVKLRMLGAKFGEVPFVLRYDHKRSSSKMVANITTLGYFMLVILYYWPWNGWRSHYKHTIQALKDLESSECAPHLELTSMGSADKRRQDNDGR